MCSGTQPVSATQGAEAGAHLGKRKTWRRRKREINSVPQIRAVCHSVRITSALYFTSLPLNITRNLSSLTFDEPK